ncbi:hypothetical protein [Flavobacterium aquiphilum]|uniref:hypothetical protein n=1 Tax=Flavobacterium aquiphilum TaxID=3003261 RepID=UPI00248052C3|nr:hypothetical protein [Flavobacterium aquiphilum]
MNLQEIYQNQLKELRENPNLLDNLSIESAKDNNYNQIARNKVLIAIFNDIKTSDYNIVNYIFIAEKELRQSKKSIENYEVDVLYLAAYLLTKFNNIDDIWQFWNSKETDFDSSIGFDTEYLLSFGVDKVLEYLRLCDNPNKEKLIQLVTVDNSTPIYTQEEINEWKNYKHQYFAVYEFPIKDEVDFAFQAKEYEYLKQLLSDWLLKKNEWTEYQNLTNIGIGKELKLDDFLLDSLINYNNKFQNSIRIEMHKNEIDALSKKLNRNISRETNKNDNNLIDRFLFWKKRKKS